MTEADTLNPVLVEARRGDFVERRHRGAYAVCDATGAVVAAQGDIDRSFLPRSATKMIQALPLVESGAAAAMRVDARRLALACASHVGSAAHAGLAGAWLEAMGLSEADLMCGSQQPDDADEVHALRAAGRAPSQLHNNCSGKHTGFLCLACHLGAPAADYIAIDHPVQRAVAEAFAAVTGQDGPLAWAADGCSAPNFAASLAQLAGAMARYADPAAGFRGVRAEAAATLRDAMMAHPDAVSGEGRASTALMRAARGRAAVKGGAEGCYVAILPQRGVGIALKIDDGSTPAAEIAMASLLARFGAVDAAEPSMERWLAPKVLNRRGWDLGRIRATAAVTGS
jgi:L-asparaginase II